MPKTKPNELNIPKPNGVDELVSFNIPKVFEQSSLTVQLKAKGPVDARIFAKLVTTTIKLLEAVGKNVNPDNDTYWCLTEAAIIGEHATFTLSPYSRAAVGQHLAEQEARDE